MILTAISFGVKIEELVVKNGFQTKWREAVKAD